MARNTSAAETGCIKVAPKRRRTQHHHRSHRFPYEIHAAQRRRRSLVPVLAAASKSKTLPSLILQAVVIPGEKSEEGQIVRAVAIPWFEIVKVLTKDESAIYEIDWRKWEEIIAGAYIQQGFEVVLTPRSNDRGRDVIASRRGFGSVRIFDQVKAYKPGHLVTAHEIRAMLGVLEIEGNVSKGIVTTTSSFAPGVSTDAELQRFIPYRLELKAKDELLQWLLECAQLDSSGHAANGT